MQTTVRFTPVVEDATLAVQRLTAGITDINIWTSAISLRFNPSKAEIVWLGAGHLLQQVDISVTPVLSSTVKPPLVYSPAHGAVNTSLQCSLAAGPERRVELRLRVSHTDRLLQRRQRICLPTFDSAESAQSMVVLISVHLLTEHWLFHGRAPASGTQMSQLTEHFAVYVTTE